MGEQTVTNAQVKAKSRKGVLRKFGKDERGVAAIEFAILAMPFLLVLFAVLESTISFASQQVMADTVDDMARSIRVGNLRMGSPEAAPAAIKTKICDDLELFVANGCPELVVDMKVYPTYSDIPTSIPRKPDKDVNTSGFAINVGDAQEIQMLRIFYRWKFYTHFIGEKVAELPGDKTLLYAAAAWKNEPFAPITP